jgi:hypothetical protein
VLTSHRQAVLFPSKSVEVRGQGLVYSENQKKSVQQTALHAGGVRIGG